jgi:hypothetical protein
MKANLKELGELRHDQHASVHQLLREYELLRGILETFVGEEAESACCVRVLGRVGPGRFTVEGVTSKKQAKWRSHSSVRRQGSQDDNCLNRQTGCPEECRAD